MKFIAQHDQTDCGPASLAMISKYYGKSYTIERLRSLTHVNREGVSLLGINEAAKKLGFDTFASKLTVEALSTHVYNPCVLHWNKNHFVVLEKVTYNFFTKKVKFKVLDPSHGVIKLSKEVFEKHWLSDDDKGVVLFLSPTESFYEKQPEKPKKLSAAYIFSHLTNYKKQLGMMFLLLLGGSGLTLILPFLTQQLIDKGVNAKDMNTVVFILLAQLSVYFGSMTIEIIRNWLVLVVGTRLSIHIISDFLKKMLRLPLQFFDAKMMGDFNQRIQDNERVENFLTSQSLMTLFSMLTFMVFFGVLWYYDYRILLIYVSLTFLAVLWSTYWLKKRKYLDYFRFQEKSKSHDAVFEMINGVTELKLNQFDDYKRREWEGIQQKLFAVNKRILKLDQMQLTGFQFINEIKNILVTFVAATAVVYEQMTLGELLGVSYIIGQMNAPVNQLVSFFRSFQDARLSLERLSEVQHHPEEERDDQLPIGSVKCISNHTDIRSRGITLSDLSFQYEGPSSPYVLEDINLYIPDGKITAIVGASGSGKTTLMKLLLKFYPPTEGTIYYDHMDSSQISAASLRSQCGIVMQDGYIFSDTIERNIATKDEEIDPVKIEKALTVANINEYVSSLPLKLNTKIGSSGNGISGGQKQRILIARAVYHDPKYIFFDEATSALDAENEKVIHDNLQEFFRGKTVVIIAHRLSTVKNADQIIVMKKGQIIEQGTHQQLVHQRSSYFHLVKNQLELGA